MSEDLVGQAPAVFSSRERSALVARALSDAARRARFSTKRRRSLATGGLRERRGARLFNLLAAWTFAGIVLIPGLAYAGYLVFLASPQYTAEARFTVRGGLPPSLEGMGKNTNAPSLLIIQDTQVILNYMQSRAMVEELERSAGYRSMFEDPSIDWLSRLKPDQAVERVLKYWKQHVAVNVQMPSGIVVFTVRAFSPEDAVKLSNAALHAAEQLINRMNASMRDDAMTLAETERRRAQASLAAKRADLERARNGEGILSATDENKGMNALIATVQTQVLQYQQEFDSQRRYVRADAPQLKSLQTKIDAGEKQVVALKAKLTQTNAAAGARKVLSGSMSRLDQANLESTIAEKIYAAALTALEQAHLAVESKLMYINTFVQPVVAQQAEYPKRGLDLLIFTSIAVGVWGAIMGVLALCRGSLA